MFDFLKRVWAAMDTPEGVAIAVALLWSALAQWAGVPEKAAIPGIPGEVSPAGLLTIAVPVILAKLGWSTPFKPTTVSQMERRETPAKAPDMGGLGLILVLFGLVATVLPAHAEDPPALSFDRFSAGARVVAQVTDLEQAVEVEPGVFMKREVGFVVGVPARYGLTSHLELTGSAERQFNAGELIPPHWRFQAGPALLLPFSNSREQWWLAVDRTWIKRGETTDPGRWVFRLQFSWGMQDPSGRDAAFAIARARFDPGVSRDFGAGVTYQAIGGKPRQEVP